MYKIFVSAYLPEQTQSLNRFESKRLFMMLAEKMANGTNITGISRIRGRYDGHDEESYMVDYNGHFDGAIAMKELAAIFNQESILVVCPMGRGELHFCDGRPSQSIGMMKTIPLESATLPDAYSIIESDPHHIVVFE